MNQMFTQHAINEIIYAVFERMSSSYSNGYDSSYRGANVRIDNLTTQTIIGGSASLNFLNINGQSVGDEIIALKNEVAELKHLLCILTEDEEKLKKHVILADLYHQYKTAEALLRD